MFGRMFNKLLGRDRGELSLEQPQREAVVDTLVFAMMADGDMGEEERDEIDVAFDTLGWDGEFDREAFITESVERAVAAKESAQAATDYIEELGKRLATDAMRDRAYELAARIVCADKEVTDSERGLMSMFIRGFKISEARAIEISATAHKDFEML